MDNHARLWWRRLTRPTDWRVVVVLGLFQAPVAYVVWRWVGGRPDSALTAAVVVFVGTLTTGLLGAARGWPERKNPWPDAAPPPGRRD